MGNARTALFNWLFARHTGGTFVVRIEDTDAERSRTESADAILTAMSWLGMEPDEGPYRQSDRGDRYNEVIEQLWSDGYLYACDCTRDEVFARTHDQATPGYDGHCRDRGLARSERTALRFRTPDQGSTVVHDLIRGDVEFPHQAMEDFVCVKSTGQPLFVLANTVDDRDSAISHVIRGEDLLPTTPKGLLVWGALDGDDPVALPVFAHLPMLVNEQRKKLSKRRDPVAVESFRDQGYLAAAFRNYLALLGWSPPGAQEKVDLETLVREFRLEDVHHGPAFFDVKKLTHMNGEYIRALSHEEFVRLSAPWVRPWSTSWRPSDREPPWSEEQFSAATYERIAPFIQERVATFGEIPAMVEFFFLEEPRFDDASFAKVITNDPLGRVVLEGTVEAFERLSTWESALLHETVAAIGDANGLALRKAQAPIRCAVTGTLVGPPLFESLEVLGRKTTIQRLRDALARAA